MFGALAGTGVNDSANTVSDLLQSFIPGVDELTEMLRNRFDLNVNANNELSIDLYDILGVSLDLSAVDIPLPPLIEGGLDALEEFLPFFNRTQFEEANITIEDLGLVGQDVALLDLIEGNLDLNVGELLDTLQNGDLTTFEIPLEPLLD